MTARRDLIIGLVILAVAIALPFTGMSRYFVSQITLLFIWATVVTQWNLVLGVAGIFSLAQMAIFAFGGYSTAMIGLYLEWNLWAALPVSAAVSVIVGVLIGLACLRLTGAYVALLTLSISVALFVLIVTDTDCIRYEGAVCRSLTEGWRGLGRYGDFGFRDWLGGRDYLKGNYYLALVLLAIATAGSILVVRSRVGLAFKALRDNRLYAASRGVSRFKYQLLVFAYSAFFTGLAGSVYAGNFTVIGPNILQLPLLLLLLSMLVIGGSGTIWGPLAGSLLLMVIDEVLKEGIIQEYRTLILGVLLAVFVMYLPRGVVGSMEVGFARLQQRWPSWIGRLAGHVDRGRGGKA